MPLNICCLEHLRGGGSLRYKRCPPSSISCFHLVPEIIQVRSLFRHPRFTYVNTVGLFQLTVIFLILRQPCQFHSLPFSHGFFPLFHCSGDRTPISPFLASWAFSTCPLFSFLVSACFDPLDCVLRSMGCLSSSARLSVVQETTEEKKWYVSLLILILNERFALRLGIQGHKHQLTIT